MDCAGVNNELCPLEQGKAAPVRREEFLLYFCKIIQLIIVGRGQALQLWSSQCDRARRKSFGCMSKESGLTLNFDDPALSNLLFGPQDEHLRVLSGLSGLRLSGRGNSVAVIGEAEAASRMGRLLTQLYSVLKEGGRFYPRDLAHAYAMVDNDPDADVRTVFNEAVFTTARRRTVSPKTVHQREYVAALKNSEMIFAVGPAGTGKTYLAVAAALALLLAKKVQRLILTRPAVEAGERLGFLPGDMAQKVNPYLRPLYDALHDMLDFDRVAEMMETGVIEVAPLAFMRGRTLSDAFVILDEAQNTTPEQMKMFLTRMGFGSRMVITGDVTQIDLPLENGRERSGLIQALKILDGVKGIHIQHFTEEDVVRHPLVSRIVTAYGNG